MSSFKNPTNNRVDSIRRQAAALARSGRHVSCLTIESELSLKGFPDARQALLDPVIRAYLQRLCAERWKPDAMAGRNRLAATG
jgi:hypothetical protein